jgi:hypothetical protein
VMLSIIKWAFKKPTSTAPTIILGALSVWMLVLVGLLYLLTLPHALNKFAMLSCFAALFIVYQTIVAVFAYRTFGVIFKKP